LTGFPHSFSPLIGFCPSQSATPPVGSFPLQGAQTPGGFAPLFTGPSAAYSGSPRSIPSFDDFLASQSATPSVGGFSSQGAQSPWGFTPLLTGPPALYSASPQYSGSPQSIHSFDDLVRMERPWELSWSSLQESNTSVMPIQTSVPPALDDIPESAFEELHTYMAPAQKRQRGASGGA